MRLGSRKGIVVWDNPWIPEKFLREARARGSVLHPNLKVNYLINPITKDWHVPILQEFMDPGDIPLIRRLDINSTFKSDSIIWHFTKSGRYWLLVKPNINIGYGSKL